MLIRNVSDTPAVLNATPSLVVPPGVEVEAEISEAEVKALATFGIFEVVEAKAKPKTRAE